MSPLILDLISFVRDNAPLFVLTGAGCSTDSGIPDYRDNEGNWKGAQPMEYARFMGSNDARQQYWARSMSGWPRFSTALPNSAHRALARLETAGYVEKLVTQNVDGLHQRAGSRSVIDLHGRLDQVECTGCGARSNRARYQMKLETLNPGHGSDFVPAPDGDADIEVCEGLVVPDCEFCGKPIKPSIVFFGESVPKGRVAQAMRALAQSKGMLVVGSSLMVYSGFRFCRSARELGKSIAAINQGKTRADGMLELKLNTTCGPVLEHLAEVLDC